MNMTGPRVYEGGVMYLKSVDNYVKKFNELHPEDKCKIAYSYLRAERIASGECLYLYLTTDNEYVWEIAINNINNDGSIKTGEEYTILCKQKFQPYEF
tara:strand:- start:1011 stop:1304 length:294 start_codon:yes stop_codon:yes gene_type:complete